MGLWKATRLPGSPVPYDDSGRFRRPVVAGVGWLAAAGIATLIGLGGIRLVGDSLTGTPGGVLSAGQVRQALAEASSSPSAEPTPDLPSVDPLTTDPSTTDPSTTDPSTTDPSTAEPTPSARPAGTSTTGGQPVGRRSFSVPGGTALAECDDGTAYLRSWSPAQGYRVDKAEPGPGREVRVRFRGANGRSELRIRCSTGVPVAEGREDHD